MSRYGRFWLRCSRLIGITCTGKPRRSTAFALVFLLLFTGTFQQALDDYARDLAIRIATHRDQVDARTGVAISGTAAGTSSETYVYDELDRLEQATYSGSGSVFYEYDSNGNRTNVTSGGSVTNYTIDDADQLTELRDGSSTLLESFSYDNNGNRTADGTSSYAWDWNNRLVSATVSGSTVTYTYAGDGLRASRTISAVTTEFLWDRETGLPEIVDDGTRITVQTPIGALGQFDASTGDGTYPLHDALGTARVQTDDTGSVVGTADYDVYGNLRASSGTQTSEGWTGETRDASTGLTYLRARDYEPRTGRFLSADTESPNGSLTQGFNPYHYTGNNPTTRTDPSGHNWMQQAIDAVGQVADTIVQLVYLMRDFMRSDDIPPFVKKFIGALLTFGIAMMTMLLEILLINVVVSAAGGVMRAAIGGAIFLSRMRVAFTMSKLFARCIGSPLCSGIGTWLALNPDCSGELGQAGVNARMSGKSGLITWQGLLGLGVDASNIAIECVDPNVSDNTAQRPVGTRGPPKGTLRSNMMAERPPPHPSYHAHHIVAIGANKPGAAEARDLLQGFGIQIQDPVNGAWLPGNKSSPNPTGSIVHSSLHKDTYYIDVYRRLSTASTREDAILVLAHLRYELESGTYQTSP